MTRALSDKTITVLTQPCSLTITFGISLSIMAILSMSKVYYCHFVSVAEQSSLCFTFLETRCFIMMRLILILFARKSVYRISDKVC